MATRSAQDLVDLIKEIAQEAVEEIDLEDKGREAVNDAAENYDFTEHVQQAIDDIDIESKVVSEVKNYVRDYDFTEVFHVEDYVNTAIKELDLRDIVKNTVKEYLGSQDFKNDLILAIRSDLTKEIRYSKDSVVHCFSSWKNWVKSKLFWK